MEKEKIIKQDTLKHGDVWKVSINGIKCAVEIDADDYLPPRFNNVFCSPFGVRNPYQYNPVTGEGRDSNSKPIEIKFYKVLYRLEF